MADNSAHIYRPNFVHTLLSARDYQDRPEFDDLRDWWHVDGVGVCALVGIGGAGKTAIAERCLRVIPGAMPDDPNLAKDDTLPTPTDLFVFSFYFEPNPGTFFDELYEWVVTDFSVRDRRRKTDDGARERN